MSRFMITIVKDCVVYVRAEDVQDLLKDIEKREPVQSAHSEQMLCEIEKLCREHINTDAVPLPAPVLAHEILNVLKRPAKEAL